jgi:hypothetical protein
MAYGIRTDASAALPANGCTGNRHAVSDPVDHGKRTMKTKILLLIVFLFSFYACNDYTISEDALYPLKIGVLVPDESGWEQQLQYLEPGETCITYAGGSYNGEELENTNLQFSIAGGFCTLTSDNGDVEICKQKGAAPFYRKFFGNWGNMSFSLSETVAESGWLTITPLGARNGHITFTDQEMVATYESLSHIPPEEHDYYLTAEAFDLDGKRIVTAKLRVVNLADYEKWEDGKSPYYSVTLEEYTLSDNYMMFLQ